MILRIPIPEFLLGGACLRRRRAVRCCALSTLIYFVLDHSTDETLNKTLILNLTLALTLPPP